MRRTQKRNYMKPLVSIIMPAFNSSRFIAKSIDSVHNQTYQDWELLVVDDASTDDTPSIVRHFQSRDARIKLIRLEENSGAAKARNTALEEAKGRYFAFLDSDDLWTSEKLEIQLSFMKKHESAFTYGYYARIDEEGTLTGKIVQAPTNMGYHRLLTGNDIGCLTVMIDTNVVGSIEFPPVRVHQDWAMWLALLRNGIKATCIPQVLGSYRLSTGSISRSKMKTLKAKWIIYRRVERLSFIASSVCLLIRLGRGVLKELRLRGTNAEAPG